MTASNNKRSEMELVGMFVTDIITHPSYNEICFNTQHIKNLLSQIIQFNHWKVSMLLLPLWQLWVSPSNPYHNRKADNIWRKYIYIYMSQILPLEIGDSVEGICPSFRAGFKGCIPRPPIFPVAGCIISMCGK